MSLPTAPTLEGTKTHGADEAKLFSLMVTSRALSLSSVTIEGESWREGEGGNSDRDWDRVSIMLMSACFLFFTVFLIPCPFRCLSSYFALFLIVLSSSSLCDMAHLLNQINFLCTLKSVSHVVLHPSCILSALSSFHPCVVILSPRTPLWCWVGHWKVVTDDRTLMRVECILDRQNSLIPHRHFNHNPLLA